MDIELLLSPLIGDMINNKFSTKQKAFEQHINSIDKSIDLFGWNKKAETAPTAACGSACGAGDKPVTKSAACGSACGAGDKPAEIPAVCGTVDKPAEKPAACGSACGAGDK